MKNNAFTDIILNWNRLSTKQKIQRLQDFENMLARFQERSPRKIVLINMPKDQALEERNAAAGYIRGDNKIYFYSLDYDPVEVAKLVIHEGFHAYVDDFINGKVPTLKTFSKVDEERFKIEQENLDAIRHGFARGDERFPEEKGGYLSLFDSYFVEERLNFREDSIYLLKYMIDSIENVVDAQILQHSVIMALDYEVENENRGKSFERKFGKTYDQIVVDCLNDEKEYEKVDMSKCGKFRGDIDPEFVAFYEKMKGLYEQFYKLSKNSLMMPAQKEQMSAMIAFQIQETYATYVKEMLKNKKKN